MAAEQAQVWKPERRTRARQELQDVLVELIHLLSGTRSLGELKSGNAMLSFTASPVGTPGSPVDAMS